MMTIPNVKGVPEPALRSESPATLNYVAKSKVITLTTLYPPWKISSIPTPDSRPLMSMPGLSNGITTPVIALSSPPVAQHHPLILMPVPLRLYRLDLP